MHTAHAQNKETEKEAYMCDVVSYVEFCVVAEFDVLEGERNECHILYILGTYFPGLSEYTDN